MAFFYKCLSVVAFSTVLLLDQATINVEACSCFPGGDLCDYVDSSGVVLRATVLSRSEQEGINDDITYTMALTTLYKEEPDVEYPEEISIVTGGNSALCGVSLQEHEEYLLGPYRSGPSIFNPGQDGQLRVSICGLVRIWSSVTEEDEESLEDGCGGDGDDDQCDGACSEFQECLFYSDSSTEEYYCADVCDPSPCEDGEMCSLVEVQCFRAPCPPLSICSGSSD